MAASVAATSTNASSGTIRLAGPVTACSAASFSGSKRTSSFVAKTSATVVKSRTKNAVPAARARPPMRIPRPIPRKLAMRTRFA